MNSSSEIPRNEKELWHIKDKIKLAVYKQLKSYRNKKGPIKIENIYSNVNSRLRNDEKIAFEEFKKYLNDHELHLRFTKEFWDRVEFSQYYD